MDTTMRRPQLPPPLHFPPNPIQTPNTLDSTKQLHARLIKTKFHGLPNSTPSANLTSLLASYTANSAPLLALRLYAHTRRSNPPLDNFTLTSVIKACARSHDARVGKEVHGYGVKLGFDEDVFVNNSLVQMYAECGSMEGAEKVFDGMPDRDVVSWSTIVKAYARKGRLEDAVGVVGEMLAGDIKPSVVALLNMVDLFADVGDLGVGRAMHAYVVKNSGGGTVGVDRLSTGLVDMYVKCGGTEVARRIFDRMPEKCVAVWTSMIAGYVRIGDVGEGLRLFEMMREDVVPNEITVLSLLIECGATQAFKLGKWLHVFILKNGFDFSKVLVTALIDMYSKCGEMERARSLFDRMHERDTTTYTAMISGFAKANCLNEAVQLFRLMKQCEVKPNGMTMVALLFSCAEVGALDVGKGLHAYIDKEGVDYDLVLTTALVDMYSKCGDIDSAFEIFSRTTGRDTQLWNAMINGFALHGSGQEALNLFSQMEEERVNPSLVTFIGLLHGCAHSGLVEEGKRIFTRMESDFGLTPELDHYGCMVDLLGRAGLLEEALEMINNMPMKPNIVVWGALLAGCKLHKNTKIGEEAASKIIELDPQNTGYNVLLSNIYALEKRWEDVALVRKNIKETCITKTQGISSIEVNGTVHEFAMWDDLSHPQSREIEAMVQEMIVKLRCAGHVPVLSAALLNVDDEEEKEAALAHHSEKLAIGFGLINTKQTIPIRIVKNLRICDDCHAAAKLLSEIYRRSIIIRDRNRFHHFRDGSCSCGDYW